MSDAFQIKINFKCSGDLPFPDGLQCRLEGSIDGACITSLALSIVFKRRCWKRIKDPVSSSASSSSPVLKKFLAPPSSFSVVRTTLQKTKITKMAFVTSVPVGTTNKMNRAVSSRTAGTPVMSAKSFSRRDILVFAGSLLAGTASAQAAKAFDLPSFPSLEELKGSVPSPGQVQDALPTGKDVKDAIPSSPEELERKLPSERDVKNALPTERDVKNALPTERDVKNALPSEGDVKSALPSKGDVKDAIPSEGEVKSSLPSKSDVERALPTQQDLKDALPSQQDLKNAIPSPEELKDALPKFDNLSFELPGKKDLKEALPNKQNADELPRDEDTPAPKNPERLKLKYDVEDSKKGASKVKGLFNKPGP